MTKFIPEERPLIPIVLMFESMGPTEADRGLRPECGVADRNRPAEVRGSTCANWQLQRFSWSKSSVLQPFQN